MSQRRSFRKSFLTYHCGRTVCSGVQPRCFIDANVKQNQCIRNSNSTAYNPQSENTAKMAASGAISGKVMTSEPSDWLFSKLSQSSDIIITSNFFLFFFAISVVKYSGTLEYVGCGVSWVECLPHCLSSNTSVSFLEFAYSPCAHIPKAFLYKLIEDSKLLRDANDLTRM